MLVNNTGVHCNMSLQRLTRTVQGASGYEDCTFANIDKAWFIKYPNWEKTSSAQVYRWPAQKLFEAITPNSSKDHKTWKAFEHFKSEANFAHGASAGGVLISAKTLPSAGQLSTAIVYDDRIFGQSTAAFGVPGQYDFGLDEWYSPRSDGGFIPVPSNLEDLKFRSCRAMFPRIKNNLELLVSLYEAKDILTIKGSAKRAAGLAKALFQKIRGLSTRPLKRALLRGAADSYLQWMFNLKPLISDICGIYRTIATYERRINDFVNRSGTVQQAHFRCDLHEQLTDTSSAWSSWKPVIIYKDGTSISYTNCRTSRRCVTDSAVFCATLQYNYWLSEYQREHAIMLGLLDSLGVNFNPKFIWEVVPWSFVVDWVIDVSRYLDQYKVENMEPKVNILQYCWSIRKVRRIYITGQVQSSVAYTGGTYGMQYIAFPQVTQTSYRRGIDLPSASSFTMSGLSPTQLSLGAALLITKSRRHRNTGLNKSHHWKGLNTNPHG